MIDALVQQDGFWWPIDDVHAQPVITRDCEPSIRALLAHVPGRDLIVQAGANVGVYPVALADHFQSVITCEPDPANYACLKRNLAARDSLNRVTALHAAFGEKQGGCMPLVVQAGNCGAHRVTYAKGETPVWTIDGLELTACDCIFLDIEGAELFALRGAQETVQRFSPTIAVEDKGLHRAFDLPDGSLQEWFALMNYELVDRIGRDKIYRKST